MGYYELLNRTNGMVNIVLCIAFSLLSDSEFEFGVGKRFLFSVGLALTEFHARLIELKLG